MQNLQSFLFSIRSCVHPTVRSNLVATGCVSSESLPYQGSIRCCSWSGQSSKIWISISNPRQVASIDSHRESIRVSPLFCHSFAQPIVTKCTVHTLQTLSQLGPPLNGWSMTAVGLSSRRKVGSILVGRGHGRKCCQGYPHPTRRDPKNCTKSTHRHSNTIVWF